MDSEKFSPRRRPATTRFAATLAAFFPAFFATAAEDVPSLTDFLYSTDTLSAQFSQEILDAAGELVEESQGSMAIHRPNRFFWRYEVYGEQLILADGENLWIYDEDLAQATRAPLNEVLATTPALLLSGDDSFQDGFEILSAETRAELTRFVLTPNGQETDFQEVELVFEGETLRRMQLRDNLGQRTRITFQDVQTNPSLDPSMFQFDPPPGVDVIGQGD